MLYFSMHTCPPCREFTPLLVELYNEYNQSVTQFEVVFLSCDKTIENFNEYYSEMPWPSLPHNDARIKSIAKTFKIKGVPRLIVLNAKTGEVINDQAVEIITEQGPVIIDEWLEKA